MVVYERHHSRWLIVASIRLHGVSRACDAALVVVVEPLSARPVRPDAGFVTVSDEARSESSRLVHEMVKFLVRFTGASCLRVRGQLSGAEVILAGIPHKRRWCSQA
jgi:hypothetical protein